MKIGGCEHLIHPDTVPAHMGQRLKELPELRRKWQTGFLLLQYARQVGVASDGYQRAQPVHARSRPAHPMARLSCQPVTIPCRR